MTDERVRQQYKNLFKGLTDREWFSPAVEVKWLGYLFHITSLENAASVINTGVLYSRNAATAAGMMYSDNADTSIIGSTDDEVKDYVRLYFRPRVPTFYHNEGFKSKQELATSQYDAHCPVPVALVFHAPLILATPGVKFSEGSLASHSAQRFAGLDEFHKLPFDKIYHHGIIADPNTKAEIIFHRQAEVIVPERLPLTQGLVGVYCRSDAEMTTLRHLLAPNVPAKYEQRLKTNADGSLFEGKRLFVESVTVIDDQAVIIFNPSRNYYGFEAVFEADFGPTETPDIRQTWHLEPALHSRVAIPIKTDNEHSGPVKLTLYLDGNRAYEAIHWLLVEDWITF